MTRIKLYILIFFAALCLPLSFVIWRTYAGVAQEELGQLRFFAETLLDEMEQELAELVRREEGRSVEAYGHTLAPMGQPIQSSPLAEPPRETFILGYLQNNPDGSLQTPLVDDLRQVPASRRALVAQLQEANRIFNQKKYALLSGAEPEKPAPIVKKQEAPAQKSFADRYLTPSEGKPAKGALGQKSVRVEELTLGQAANVARDEAWRAKERSTADSPAPASATAQREEREQTRRLQSAGRDSESAPAGPAVEAGAHPRFQVEIAPLQSVFIDDGRVFIFRRVAINDRIFRQGFVLQVAPFLEHLARTHFDPHPMAGFSHLRLTVLRGGQPDAPAPEVEPIVAARTFPAPFNFIHASVSGNGAPASAARRMLHAALIALGAIVVLGLLAIYQSVRAVVALSERRSQFVSAVTHELKTPLTNIRMYVEMLEQGIAATPEREQTYLGIIGSESARLSRLINNVLELSRLEKKQRPVHMQPGRLADLLAEVRAVMAPKLGQDGFELIFQADGLPDFAFDREALLQILINLVENSIKFGRNEAQRHITVSARVVQAEVQIAVADTGPGIARGALKKIFDDFYRADNALTRTTSGTGIGLALVRKLTQAMGGRVTAANNAGPGCTITVSLPLSAT